MKSKTVPRQTHEDALETLRELRFKVKSMGLLIQYAMRNLPESHRDYIGSAAFRLAMHTRGEKPLRFQFGKEEVIKKGNLHQAAGREELYT